MRPGNGSCTRASFVGTRAGAKILWLAVLAGSFEALFACVPAFLD